MNDNDIDKEYKKLDKKLGDRIFATLFYGVIINFVILLALESGEDIHTFYPILLVASLFGGYILSHVLSFFEHKK